MREFAVPGGRVNLSPDKSGCRRRLHKPGGSGLIFDGSVPWTRPLFHFKKPKLRILPFFCIVDADAGGSFNPRTVCGVMHEKKTVPG